MSGPSSPPDELGAITGQTVQEGRPQPTLRRILTRYFAERAPAAFMVDAALVLVANAIVHLFWTAMYERSFSPDGPKLNTVDRLLAWGNILAVTNSSLFYLMFGLFAWGCARALADAKKGG